MTFVGHDLINGVLEGPRNRTLHCSVPSREPFGSSPSGEAPSREKIEERLDKLTIRLRFIKWTHMTRR